jgi:phage shock protein A
MNLISRILNMFKAHAHSKLDNVENTAELINYKIRECNESILTAMHDIAQVKASAQILEEKRDHAKTKSAEYERKAYLLLESANKGGISEKEGSDLAIEALKLKEKYDTKCNQYDGMYQKQLDVFSTLQEKLETGKAKIVDYKNQLFSLNARMKTAQLTQKISKQVDGFDTDSLDSLVEKMKEKVAIEEAFANSQMLLSSDYTGVDERINNALNQNASIEVQKQLLQLKRRLE